MIILVYVCGMCAVFVELFVPGVIMGMLGFLTVVGTIIFAFVSGYQGTGAVLIGVTIAFVPVFFMLWKHVMGRYFAIHEQETGFMPSSNIDKSLVGVEGLAATPLRPSGIAQLDGRRHHVVTRGEMLEKGSRIKVVEVSGNRVVVARIGS